MAIIRKLLMLIFISDITFSFAYDPEPQHRVLSEIALTLYPVCFDDEASTNNDEFNRIIQGNIAMDKGLHVWFWEDWRLKYDNNFNLSKRIFNWHFYNPDGQAENDSEIMFIEQSNKDLCEML